MNNIVNIEIAKLAKKAGFDDPCYYRWTETPVKGLVGKACSGYRNSMYKEAKIERFTAPDKYSLLSWLVSQGVIISIVPNVVENPVYKYVANLGYKITLVSIDDENEGEVIDQMENFYEHEESFADNYEEVMNKALIRALKEFIKRNVI